MAIERQPDWIAEAPIRIERSATMNRSAAWVWERLADNERWVEWFPGFRACHFTSDAPHGAGSTRFVRQDQFKVTERITEWDPEQRWAMTVTSMNLPVLESMAEDVLLDELDGKTTVQWRIGVELTRFGRLLQRPLEAKTLASLEKALENLARM